MFQGFILFVNFAICYAWNSAEWSVQVGLHWRLSTLKGGLIVELQLACRQRL
jgi:hypothetical protein